MRAIISERWIPIQSEFYVAAEQLAIMRKAQDAGRIVEHDFGVSVGGQYQKVDGLRKQLHAIVRELEDRVNEELRS